MLFLIIFLAMFVRLFRFPELSWFFGDQGIDLMVAQRALKDEVWPMVGPYLGIPNFFVPPTYYWLLVAFLWIGKTPETVTLFFVGMDLVTLVLFYRLASLFVDKKTGVIAGVLYAISVTTANQGRSMWQPHPVQLFLVASLFFLARSRLVAAWSLYGIALSIYPSPIALLPFFLYHTWRWVKRVKTVCLAALGFMLPFAPLVLFEARSGYPTYASFFSGSFGIMPWWDMLGQFALNLFGIVSEVSSPWSFHPRISVLIVPVVALLFGAGFVLARARFGRDPRLGRTFSFLSPFWLFVGFASLLFYREMNAAWHRLWGFVPFAFLALAIVLRVGLRWRSVTYRAIIVSLAGLYFLGNGLTFWEQAGTRVERYDNPIGRSRRVAVAIDASARAKGMRDADFSAVAYTPTDVWSYAVTPELYFLREIRDYPVPFTRAGNDLDRAVWGNDNRPYIYLLCKEYTRAEDVEKTCLGTFAARNPPYVLEERLLFDGDTTAFLFRRADISVLSL